jgi:hypothetical protein
LFAAGSGTLVEMFDRLPARYSKAALLKDFPRATSLKIVGGLTPETIGSFFGAEAGFAKLERVDHTDGVRMLFANGDVAHVRPSGNADELRIYAVADTQARADAIAEASIGTASRPRFGGSKYGDSDDPKHATKSGNTYTDNGTRNRRSVWTVTPKPFKGAHFATMPPDLVEPCILAGCPVGGVVLDPFTGSGTTGMVAVKHGRRFVGCELNAEYITMAEKRIGEQADKSALLPVG